MRKNEKSIGLKQKAINKKMEKLQYADEEYCITSEYLLKLASNAGKLFESSEAHEKRLLLKMALQNLELRGKKARYDWIKPFDKIAFYASRQAWLRVPSINLTESLSQVIKAFQNPIWAEQARERLKQIKLLTKAITI